MDQVLAIEEQMVTKRLRIELERIKELCDKECGAHVLPELTFKDMLKAALSVKSAPV